MQKMLSFYYQGALEWGVLSPDGKSVYRAIDLEEAFFIPLPETLADLVTAGREGMVILATALQQMRENREDECPIEALPLNKIDFAVPIFPQRNIICVGKNYRDHITEFERGKEQTLPKFLIYFTKSPTAAIACRQPIPLHTDVTSEVDYEGELAVIIGEECDHVNVTEAAESIFGYTIVNDVTARDLQRQRGQWFYGKSLSGFCPMGPCILVGKHPEPFRIITKVNGEVRQDGNTEDLIFPVNELIADLSRAFPLQPGDIIATGTPAGVGMGFEPPRFLRAGDIVEIEIEDIGTLINPVQ